jgi:hypothetical protein
VIIVLILFGVIILGIVNYNRLDVGQPGIDNANGCLVVGSGVAVLAALFTVGELGLRTTTIMLGFGEAMTGSTRMIEAAGSGLPGAQFRFFVLIFEAIALLVLLVVNIRAADEAQRRESAYGNRLVRPSDDGIYSKLGDLSSTSDDETSA